GQGLEADRHGDRRLGRRRPRRGDGGERGEPEPSRPEHPGGLLRLRGERREPAVSRLAVTVAAFAAGVLAATAVSAAGVAGPGPGDDHAGVNERATPPWLTAKVGDALGRPGTVAW